MRLPHPLDLDFADGFADPFGGLRLGGLEEDFGGGLRQHDLGDVAVDDLKLGLALEAKHQRVPAFAVLSDSRMELRQTLQARQLIQDKPYRVLVLGRRI